MDKLGIQRHRGSVGRDSHKYEERRCRDEESREGIDEKGREKGWTLSQSSMIQSKCQER